MATMLIRIEGLSPDDRERLEERIRDLPGVFGVVVSPSSGCAEIDFEDDEIDVDRVLSRVRDEGFSARISG